MANKKTWLSFTQQIDLLKNRNLTIPPAYESNNKLAESFLSAISYYRLTSYRFNLLQPNHKEHYQTDTTFNDLLNEYYNDIHYKQILFALIDIIEIGFKTQLIYCLAKIDICFHKDICTTEENNLNQKLSSLNKDDKKRKYYDRALNKVKNINAELNNCENSFIAYKIKQFNSKNTAVDKSYNQKKQTKEEQAKKKQAYINSLPSWIAVEALSLGNLINLYKYASKNGKYANASKVIATHFNVVKPKYLLQLLADIKRIRNIVAHFDKILTRESFQKSESWISIKNINSIKYEDSYQPSFVAYYLVLKHFADIVIPDKEFNALQHADKNGYVNYLLNLKHDFITLSKQYFKGIKQ